MDIIIIVRYDAIFTGLSEWIPILCSQLLAEETSSWSGLPSALTGVLNWTPFCLRACLRPAELGQTRALVFSLVRWNNTDKFVAHK